MRWLKCVVLFSLFSCCIQQISEALEHSLTPGQKIGVSDTLESKGGFYELGFFAPNPNAPSLYLGIWFTKAKTKAVVWLANRERSFKSSSPVLTFDEDGQNLVVLDGKTSYQVTNTTEKGKNRQVVLLDSGNLVLQDKKANVFWESFDYPTDNLLPGMKLGYDNSVGKVWELSSWKTPTDPSRGSVRMVLDPNGSGWSFILRQKGPIAFAYGTYWLGETLNSTWSIDVAGHKVVYNYFIESKDYGQVMFDVNGTDLFYRYKAEETGELKVLIWTKDYTDWVQLFMLPNRECDFYGYCGNYAICDQQSSGNPCYCLPGYTQAKPDDWANQNYLDGCALINNLQCGNSSSGGNTKFEFVEVPHVTLPGQSEITFGFTDEEDCRASCARNCSCKGYSFRHSRCAVFTREVTNVQRLPDKANNTETIFIKVAKSDFNTQEDNSKQYILTGWKLWITVVTTLSAAVISTGLFIYHFWKDKLSRVEGKDLLSYNFIETRPEEMTVGEEHERGYQIPLFTFPSICATTDDFSAVNKLGKGGFGAVYKGTLQNGEEIAIKRLSKITPGKGSKEIKNEAFLIAELRHENLARLLGCCLEGNENIIIYEYFPLRSLDLFLFDPATTKKLDWENRVRIIHGIAAGLNYLHEYSRLQIIHGDLKASNILLDEKMNPKISDFAMTRIYGAKETLATNRMFGTFGYMSPEYASKGLVSNKSDVFSYGVLVLEILSGKKNNFRNASCLNLLGYAWDLWSNNEALDLIDPNIGELSSVNVKRYIEIAFLCVQESDNERPTMSDVVLYLGNEAMDLPAFREPAFAKARALF